MKNKTELLTLMAVILGIILGIIVPNYAIHIAFLGEIFLSLLKVLILPIIIFSLFLAVSQISTLDKLKNIGLKTLIYYFSTTALAVLTSIVLVNIFIFEASTTTIVKKATNTDVNIVKQIFSSNIFESLANGQILHIVVFVLLFSIAFISLPTDKKQPIIDGTKTLYEVILKLIHWVLKIAPIGVFSLVWNAVSKFNYSDFQSVKTFFIATTIAVVMHCFINLALIANIFGKFNLFHYFLKVKDALIIAFATASSSASLPVSVDVSQKAGVQPKVAQFTLPLGATLNMDGSALYQSLLVMLFAHLAGIDLTIGQQFLLFIFIALSSAGTAGIPSGGIVMMTLVLNLFEIPDATYYISLYIMVDRFWDYPITAVNVWSDLVGAKTINHYCK